MPYLKIFNEAHSFNMLIIMKKTIENFNAAKEIISFVSTFIFIFFSLILYFSKNNKIFFIPLILYTANLFMLIEMFIIFRKNEDIKTKKNTYWLTIQIFVNILGIIVSYFAYKY